jgi:hypothetical protein
MPHFFGHTHTRRDRRGSSLGDRTCHTERNHAVEGDLGGTSGGLGAPPQNAIAELAYSYWLARGGEGGSELEDWFRAERELKERRVP